MKNIKGIKTNVESRDSMLEFIEKQGQQIADKINDLSIFIKEHSSHSNANSP
jgi:hypothetical protein